jgi:uncharacterized protein YdcH (DUF465 family)
MFQFLGPILSLVSEPVKSFMETRTIKAENKAKIEEAKVNAQIRGIERTAESEINYDIEALRQQQYSWKDEFALLVITLPFIGSFLPWTQEFVMLGWDYVSRAPEWYSYTFIGAISASLGIRWATKMFGKK